MSKEDLNQFWQMLSENAILQQQLEAAPNLQYFLELVVEIGATYGYEFTIEEAKDYIGMGDD